VRDMTKTHYFEFDFSHKGKTIPATCHVYYPEKSGSEMFYNYPIYRVAVNYHKIDPDVYLFYEVDNDEERFFWYPLPDLKEEISRSIAEHLETFDYRRTNYEIVKKPFWAI
jgi:hypothetical protein